MQCRVGGKSTLVSLKVGGKKITEATLPIDENARRENVTGIRSLRQKHANGEESDGL